MYKRQIFLVSSRSYDFIMSVGLFGVSSLPTPILPGYYSYFILVFKGLYFFIQFCCIVVLYYYFFHSWWYFILIFMFSFELFFIFIVIDILLWSYRHRYLVDYLSCYNIWTHIPPSFVVHIQRYNATSRLHYYKAYMHVTVDISIHISHSSIASAYT